jgi:hypothetical protein
MRVVVSLGLASALASLAFASACGAPSASHQADAATDDAGTLMDAPPAIDAADGGDDPAPVLWIDVSPLPLIPTFSQSIHDYYVRCAAGANVLTLTVTDEDGSQTSTVTVNENDATVVRNQYWIRCLAHDFPVITVINYPDLSPTPGYYLVNAAKYAVTLDTNGTPVWYSHGALTWNVDSPAHDTLSFVPNATAPYGWNLAERSETHALDSLTLTTVMAVDSPTDGHELRVLPNGNHLLFAYPVENHINLTGLQAFGSDENMADCEIQEIDPSGLLVWSWLARDHIDPVQESIEPGSNKINGANVIDAFHCNSIEVDATGNLLVSARHTNSLFYINRSTDMIEWKVGGTPYNKDGAQYLTVTADPQGSFNMQHDARFLPSGHITLFDDHGATAGVARGVEYALDHTAGTATFVLQFLGSGQSGYEGSFRRYADGHSVIGWGYVAMDPRILTEVDTNGNDVLDIAFTGGPSYRSIKVPLSQLDIGVLRSTTAK